MKVYIYGFQGNMSRRYRAILASLGHEVSGEDLGDAAGNLDGAPDAYIIATPTSTHVELLRRLKDCGRPVLCEKPITKHMGELEAILWELKIAGTRLGMVSQYDYLGIPDADEPTVYDYYRHGTDGIVWDCINIVKHARGKITLREKSPVWTCQINGKKLSIADMDHAYVAMLNDWLRDPKTDYEGILAAHKKAAELEASGAWQES